MWPVSRLRAPWLEWREEAQQMGLSWTRIRLHFKSPVRVVTRVLWQSRENKARKCRNLRQQLDEAKRAIAQQDAEIQQQKEIRVPANAPPGRPELAAGADGMPFTGGSALEGAQVWSPNDPSGGESSESRGIASGRARLEDCVEVAWGAATASSLDDDSHLVYCTRCGSPAGAHRTGRRLGLDGGSLQSNWSREGAWSCWVYGLRSCHHQEKPSSMRMSTC